VEGNSKLALSQSLAQLAGPGLTGGLVQLLGAPLALVADALSFLGSALSLSLIRALEPQPDHDADLPLWRQIGAGLGMAFGEPALRRLIGCGATVTLCNSMIEAIWFLYVPRDLGVPPALFGLVLTIDSLGAFLSAGLAERVVRRFGRGPAL